MELGEAISKFKVDLESIKKDGVTQVEIANLFKYLDDLAASATMSAEERRMRHESNLAFYNASNAMQVANFNAVMAAGKEAINATIILNGGAIIPLMAFMGNAAAKPGGSHYVAALSPALLVFGVGALSGGLAFGFRYISQFLYQHTGSKWAIRGGHIVNALSWLSTIGAVVLFACAVYQTYLGLNPP